MSQEVWFNKKTKQNVKYLGTRNKISPCNEEFVKICKLDKKQLKNYLVMFLFEVGYKEVNIDDGFIYAKGEIPFCVTAHMDTVHTETVKVVYEYEKDGDYYISSPQGIGGDDRCGIYMIMNILRNGNKPYVVFCEDEEVGCVGSKKFVKTDYINELKDCKYIIELDRANANDCVFYECANREFEEFIEDTTGYVKNWGSCSDISVICPACKVAGVNLSCGYYNAHTLGEYVSMNEMKRTQTIVEKLLKTECVAYEYVERTYGGYAKACGYDDDWYDWTTYRTSYNSNAKVPETYWGLEITTGDGKDYYVEGHTWEEAWVEFFFNNPTYSFNDVMDYEEYCY